MRLFVTLPYHCPRDHSDREHLAQVVRIELLDDGQHGVSVQLLSSVGNPQWDYRQSLQISDKQTGDV